MRLFADRALGAAMVLLPAAVLVYQPLPGGPRPAFWLSAVIAICLIASGRLSLSTPMVRRVFAIWVLLWVPAAASVPASWDPRAGLLVLGVLAFAFPVGVFWLEAFRRGRRYRWIEFVWLATVVFWALDGLVQFFSGADLFGVPLEGGRVVGPLAGNLRMPLFLCLLAPFAAYRLAPRRPAAAIFVLALLLSVSLLGGARTQLLMALLVVLVSLPAFGWRYRVVLLLTFAASVYAVSATSSVVQSRLGQSTTSSYKAIPGKPEWFSLWDRRLTHRLSIWSASLEMGTNSPTGVGVGAFSQAYPSHTWPGDPMNSTLGDKPINHAHHVWFSLFAEEGIAGVAGLVAAMFLALRWWCVAGPAGRRRAAPYAAGLAVYLFPLSTHPPLYLFWLYPVVWLLVCGYVSALRAPTESEPVNGFNARRNQRCHRFPLSRVRTLRDDWVCSTSLHKKMSVLP